MTCQPEQEISIHDSANLSEIQRVWERLNNDHLPEMLGQTYPGFAAWAMNNSMPGTASVRIIHCAGRPIAILPVKKCLRTFGVASFRVLEPLGNDHWKISLPILGCDLEQSIIILLDALCRSDDWDMIQLGPMSESGILLPALIVEAQKMGLRPLIAGTIADPRVDLRGSWETYFSSLSGNFRSQIKRGEAKLQSGDNVVFEEYRGGADLDQKLEEFYCVEASGWKGREGTAIAADPNLRGFYSQLAHDAAHLGWLRLYFLRVGKHCVAADYCLSYAKTVHMLKVGYDENWSGCSPGQVMRKYVLEHLFRTSQEEFYDMMSGGGEHREYKFRWANQVHKLVILRLFRPRSLRGRLACIASQLRHWLRQNHSREAE